MNCFPCFQVSEQKKKRQFIIRYYKQFELLMFVYMKSDNTLILVCDLVYVVSKRHLKPQLPEKTSVVSLFSDVLALFLLTFTVKLIM